MLGPVVIQARLVHNVWKMLRVLWWEPIVVSFLNQQQFIKRISVGKPGRPFLIGDKQFILLSCHHADRKPHSGTIGFSPGEIWKDALDRSVLTLHVVMSTPLLIDQIGIVVGRGSKAKVNRTI